VVTEARGFRFVVTAAQAGERVDRVCAELLAAEGVSRSLVAKLCERGEVRLAGSPVRASARVRAGDALDVRVPPPEPTTALPEDIPLRIVYEDQALMVVDKPAGLVVHPARGHATGTLVNAVLHHADVDEDDDPVRPGIVHRIDKDTSGLLVVAKTSAAREGLIAQFRAHSIERAYTALTQGVPPDGATYDTLHGRHPTDRVRFTTRVREGKRAVTRVFVDEVLAGGAVARVRCELETGRTHQIRVHLAEAGFPLLGDALYGRRPADPRAARIASALGRQALHAARLGFVHPVTGAPMRFESAPPDDFAAALRALRALE
jgi:23S rRNA pseudouridine1911/1915/1917 synthase